MKLENQVTVGAPVERAWHALLDLERLAGQGIEPVGEDGLYRGRLNVQLDGASTSYTGTVRLADVDEDARTATWEARGRESGGPGTATAVIRNRLEDDAGGTRLVVETDLKVTGHAAGASRGALDAAAVRLLNDLAARLDEPVAVGRARGRRLAIGGALLAALALAAALLGRRKRR